MNTLNYLDHRLHFGLRNHDLTAFEKDYSEPLYIYEWSGIEDRLLRMRKAFGEDARICYAMKANSFEQILQRMSKLGCGVDTVSIGEIERAIECGFSPEKIIFSGVGKTTQELIQALKLEIHQVNVESEPELRRILKLCHELNIRARIALRLNPNVDAKTHPYISTGSHLNKFGIDHDSAISCLEFIKKNSDRLILQGLTVHVGSQILDTSVFSESVRWLLQFAQKHSDNKNLVLDIGGGLGIDYEAGDLDHEYKLLAEYSDQVRKALAQHSPRIILEPGRWLVGHSGLLLTRVEYIKKTKNRTFVIVDSGVHHLLRPALYGARHRIFSLRQGTGTEKADVVGPLCESSDVLARDVVLPQLREGDLLAVADAGAYGYEMSNEYNLRARPRRVLLE